MTDENLPAKLQLPDCIDRADLTPFRTKSKRMDKWYEFGRLMTQVFDQEAQRLGMSPERYEYSNINDIYKPNHPIWDTHYFVFDAGNPIGRGLIGNLLGREMKKKGVDLGKLFEQTSFRFDEVMFRLPGVDVGGYGNFHTFLNVVNPHLRDYNLFIAYMRYYGPASFRHGFNDLVGLIEGVPCPGLGDITAGDVDMEPVKEVEEDRLYEVEVKGGRLVMSPIASCNWNFVGLEDMEEDELEPDEIPVKDRMVDTFHWLNGVTPHYLKDRLEKALSTIRVYDKPKKKKSKKNIEK